MLIKKFFDFIVNLWKVVWVSPIIPPSADAPDAVLFVLTQTVTPIAVSTPSRVKPIRTKVSPRRLGILKRQGGYFSCPDRFVCGQ